MKSSIILTAPMKVITPIIKVVGNFCNCRCGYCFYHNEDQSMFHVINDELLHNFIRQYMELFSGRLIFIWHGGEPLLAGIPFFRRVIDFQLKYLQRGQQIQNHIQTNGILIDDEWAKFLKDYNFKVGVSIDGCKTSHDLFRKDKSGNATFDRVIKGIQILRKHGLEPGIMQTLTKSNLVRIIDDFEFFTNQLRVKGWGTNIYFDAEQVNKDIGSQNITPEELVEFMRRCIDLWLSKNDPHLKIREVENFVAGIFGKVAPNCTFNGFCTGYFCLDYDGKVYPCDRMSVDVDFSFGDLSKQSLIEILNSTKRLRYAEDVNFVHRECVMCKWHNACHNGCASHRIGGLRNKQYYCEARKTIFAYLEKRVRSLKFKTAQGRLGGQNAKRSEGIARSI